MLITTFIVPVEGILHYECIEGLLFTQTPRACWLWNCPVSNRAADPDFPNRYILFQ